MWVLDVYNLLYQKLNRDWNEYLQEPYASTLESLGEIRASVPDSLISLNPKNYLLKILLMEFSTEQMKYF